MPRESLLFFISIVVLEANAPFLAGLRATLSLPGNKHPDGEIIYRDLGRDPAPLVTETFIAAVYTPLVALLPREKGHPSSKKVG
jgi:hypothetical protein